MPGTGARQQCGEETDPDYFVEYAAGVVADPVGGGTCVELAANAQERGAEHQAG